MPIFSIIRMTNVIFSYVSYITCPLIGIAMQQKVNAQTPLMPLQHKMQCDNLAYNKVPERTSEKHCWLRGVFGI